MGTSKQFGKGQSQPHLGAARSASGTQQFGKKPKPGGSSNKKPSHGGFFSELDKLFQSKQAKSSSIFGHGGSKKKRKK